jgi:hypothetical protein
LYVDDAGPVDEEGGDHGVGGEASGGGDGDRSGPVDGAFLAGEGVAAGERGVVDADHDRCLESCAPWLTGPASPCPTGP